MSTSCRDDCHSMCVHCTRLQFCDTGDFWVIGCPSVIFLLEFQEAVRACAMRPISGFKVPLLVFGVFYLYPLLFVVYSIYTRICIIVTHPFVLWRDQGQPEIISFILSRWCDLANEYAYRFDFNIFLFLNKIFQNLQWRMARECLAVLHLFVSTGDIIFILASYGSNSVGAISCDDFWDSLSSSLHHLLSWLPTGKFIHILRTPFYSVLHSLNMPSMHKTYVFGLQNKVR